MKSHGCVIGMGLIGGEGEGSIWEQMGWGDGWGRSKVK